MRKIVCELSLKRSDIELDVTSQALVFTQLSRSGNNTLKDISKLISVIVRLANSRGEQNLAKKEAKGFKLKASKFALGITADRFDVMYDFDTDNHQDLFDKEISIVCAAISSQFQTITSCFNLMVEDPDKAYQSAGKNNSASLYEAAKIIDRLSGREEIIIAVTGEEREVKLLPKSSPPKPSVKHSEELVSFVGYEINVVDKKNRNIVIDPIKGKGKRTISLNQEQYSELMAQFGFALDKDDVFFNFNCHVQQSKIFQLISYSQYSDNQGELKLE